MKIGSMLAVTSPYAKVQEKTGQEDSSESFAQQQKKEQKKQDENQIIQVTEGKVAEAIGAFGRDEQAQIQGISAATVGSGPGLRVILKDGTGVVIRQFTGEEFLKLREAVSKDRRANGKIIDQKL